MSQPEVTEAPVESKPKRKWRVDLGDRCVLNPAEEPLPISRVRVPAHAEIVWPKGAHAHNVHGTIVSCIGPLVPHERDASLAEQIVAEVEEDARKRPCPRCKANPREGCVYEDGRPMPGISHTERLQTPSKKG